MPPPNRFTERAVFQAVAAVVIVAVFYLLRWIGVPWVQDPPKSPPTHYSHPRK